MNKVMGIIDLLDGTANLDAITQLRPLATVPFAGGFRLIDFVLSGLINSGVENVGILVPRQQRSLLDHFRFEQDWQLVRKNDGLSLLPPPYEREELLPSNDVHHLIGNLDFLTRSRQEDVIVAFANTVGNIDFQGPVRFHREAAADVTIVYQHQALERPQCSNCITLTIDDAAKVRGLRFGTESSGEENFFCGAYIVKKSLLIELLHQCFANGAKSLITGLSHFLPELHAQAYKYPGYLARIHCLDSYYRHSMELLQPEIWRQVFGQPQCIFTKGRDEAPAKYGNEARVVNSLVSDGCIMYGTAINSILSPGVKVGTNAIVQNSILMPNVEIAEDAQLMYVICDKNVKISPGNRLQGEKDMPMVIKKGTVV